MKLIFASNNLNKLVEVKDILTNQTIISLTDLADYDEVIENAATFRENAYLKASYFYNKYHEPVFSDDSGLVCQALNGAPGVLSARYSGTHANHKSNNEKLLRELKNIKDRSAYFITVICYIDKDGRIYYFEGKIEGEIGQEEKGLEGFGYDPIFYLPEFKKTLAELGTIKNTYSHRFRALKCLNEFLNKEV